MKYFLFYCSAADALWLSASSGHNGERQTRAANARVRRGRPDLVVRLVPLGALRARLHLLQQSGAPVGLRAPRTPCGFTTRFSKYSILIVQYVMYTLCSETESHTHSVY